MKSMTGYGKINCELDDKVVTIEIRSLNSKNIDLHTRLPNIYREKDMDIRNILSQKLSRGKIELLINVELLNAAGAASINSMVAKEYYRQLSELQNELGDKSEPLLPTIMRLPESLKMEKEELNDNEWHKIKNNIEKAIDKLDEFRIKEGDVLKKDILTRIHTIEVLMIEMCKHEKDRIEKVKERIRNGLSELKESESYDSNRFEQELIYYIEKLDISEEKTRLTSHCKHFKEVAEENTPIGKKLGFIAQEIGREINTIGSKANYADIQKIVVQMKDELEKAKEQLMNIL